MLAVHEELVFRGFYARLNHFWTLLIRRLILLYEMLLKGQVFGDKGMRTKITYMRLTLIAAALVLASCASTRVTSDWLDESYQKKPNKVVVMALVDQSADRRLIEDEFVGELKKSGVEALPGYAVLPEARPGDREAAAAKVKELGADALLITRLVDRKTERDYVPGTPSLPPAGYYDWHSYYGRFHHPGLYPGPYAGYYSGAYPGGYSRGYVTERVYGIAEANLYDVTTGKLVWSAVTETEMRGDNRDEIKSYVDQIVKSLRKKNLVPNG